MKNTHKIGLGGGCHWCTEAVFQAVTGVKKVDQGYIASEGEAAGFSEAVIVHYDPKKVSLKRLLKIHLHTHNSTSAHSFRKKYRSAVYFFSSDDKEEVKIILGKLQEGFEKKLVTEVLPFREFKSSRDSLQDYYKKHPEAPFCKNYIKPKLLFIKKM